MMKKLPLLLALLLTFILPSAIAEDVTPYTPGEVTEALFSEAFSRGDMLTLDMQFDLTLNENAAELFGEDAAVLESVGEALKNSIFTVGAGKIDNGLRIMLKGDYTVDAKTAVLSAALDLTETGVALSCSALPDEQITANWETLLALAGASEEEIASIMSLRDADLEALLAELVTALEPVIDMAVQIAAPYGQTILEHIAGLPMAINENVPADAGYPAAATELQIQITDKAIGALVIALADQLKQDATLCAMIDALLAETGEADAPTTAQLCDAVIQIASEELTDETLPVNLFIGTDAVGTPLYMNLSKQHEDGTSSLFSSISGKLEDTGATLFNLDILTLTADQEISNGLSFILAYTIDDANSNVMNAEVLISAYVEGEEVLTTSFYTDNAINPENPNGYNGLITMALDAADGEDVVSLGMDANIFSLRTENGEELLIEGSLTAMADEEEICPTFEGTLVTEFDGVTPVTFMTESLQMPELGIAQWSESYTLTAAPMSTEAPATVTALESASSDDLEALAARAVSSLEETLNTLLELLPPELLETAE